ncbi:aminodeoxychorismate synthase component I [Endozoicomonas sp. SCSIO W0465]|uniref:aminodeoxychorismate synthase component I n=1 Tax=Endozoicomonas sp. SCSIO W0465 TaxID=2918516 RepID=UPI002075670F|nr:aminodeoxychorismate synthase component I [Endozoicomonas sp. SCSIO W0465]USE33795.1 aminodeoxychorismate synthase component I [Endozoicomonas sp. SCSIO W0465]
MKTLTILELDYKDDTSLYFEQFINFPFPCFLDSSAFDGNRAIHKDDFSRYDIMTAAPEIHFTFTSGGDLIIEDLIQQKIKTLSETEPFSHLSNRLHAMSKVDNAGLPFVGGMVGFWGYELCEYLESGRIAHRDISTPLMSVGCYHWALISDHKERRACLVFHPDISESWKNLILTTIDQMAKPSDSPSFKLLNNFTATQTREGYQTAFQQIQDYITAGDCYEVNLTQRFTAPYSGNSWEAYKKLRTITKAPYSAFISRPDLAILSHSPEQFIRLESGHISTNPIKGTRPRGHSPEEDRAIAEELQNSQKDQSENLMIVDLLRNDLGKVCKTGTISVPRLFALESYANVHHLVSTVEGQLLEDHDAFDLLRSAFPGGSITGAPKIRSMQIIRELEPVARTIYCGSIGYISCDGNMDTSITIRTILAKDGELHCWGGGAIVADSNCEHEYQESITKVTNLMNSLESKFLNKVPAGSGTRSYQQFD